VFMGPDESIKGAHCTRDRFSSRGIDPQSLTLTLQELKDVDIGAIVGKVRICVGVLVYKRD